MIHSLKVLGLALASLLAMSGLAASSSSAHNVTSANGSYPQHLVTQDVGARDVFTVGESELTCEGQVGTGVLKAPSTVWETAPNFEKCKTLGATFYNMTVTVNECIFKTIWKEHVEKDLDRGTGQISCPAGRVIEIHHYSSTSNHSSGSSSCTYTAGSQVAGGMLDVTSKTASGDMEAHGKLTIAVQSHGICTFGFTLNTNAILDASTTGRATSGAPIHME